jgi:uncharacterized membrane protein
MKSLGKVFLTGMFTVLPIMATIYLILWLLSAIESFLGRQLKYIIPDEYYHAGMGTAAAIILIFVVGLLMRAWLFRRLLKWGETLLLHLPVVKAVYKSMKDLIGLFSEEQSAQALQVVSVMFPGTRMRLIGFVTRHDFAGLPHGIGGNEDVAVYLPMSYQVGGYTVMLPRNQVTPIDMPRDQAMRFVLTAGLTADAKQ